MARVQETEVTILSDREIAATGIGTSPAAIEAFRDIQRTVYELQPQDTADAAQAAVAAAAAAEASATAAANAAGAADTAQGRADQAYALAETKVTKDVGPTFTAPTSGVSRAALPSYTGATASLTYTPAELQEVMDQVNRLTTRLAAVITDLRANGALKP
jgi:hypothetical protein